MPEKKKPTLGEALFTPRAIALIGASDTPGANNARTQLYLEKHGYRVLDAESGVEALAIAADHVGRIDLLVTDVVLPKIDGHELAKRLQAARPETRVLYMSGFSDDALSRHGIDLRDISLIQKPFAQHELLAEVRRALGETQPPDSTSPDSGVRIPPRSEMH